jgi:hypothetical protein
VTAMQYGSEQPITVPVPPWQMWQVTQALDAQRIPYQVQGNQLVTLPVAQPIIDMIVGSQAQRGQSGGWDPMCRIPTNRNRGMDTFGFLLTLGVMAGVVWASGKIAGPALAVGLNPDLTQAAAILLGGLVAIRLMMMLVGNDPRRWMLAVGMFIGLLAPITWYVAVGIGLPMAEALERLLP